MQDVGLGSSQTLSDESTTVPNEKSSKSAVLPDCFRVDSKYSKVCTSPVHIHKRH